MAKLIVWVLGSLFATGLAFAQIPTPGRLAGSYCAPKAVDNEGNPLKGAARAAFMQKCEADSKGSPAANSACAAKAVDKNGKPLAGAAKASFMRKCVSDAKGSK